MATLKIVLSVLFIIVSLVITIVILFQEGKSAGLGTIAGVADTYWGCLLYPSRCVYETDTDDSRVRATLLESAHSVT